MVFAYSSNYINALEVSLSGPRLAKYVNAVGGDKERALRLYVFNTAMSEAFYTPLHGLEVTLRNALAVQLRIRMAPDWYVKGRIPCFHHVLHEMLDEAEGDLAEERKPITHDGMVAALRFGFWVALMAPRYENELWRPALRHAFPHRPRGIERHQIHGAINAVRRLRNRIVHHERILHRNLVTDHETILKVLSWICPDTTSWVAAHSRVLQLLAAGP